MKQMRRRPEVQHIAIVGDDNGVTIMQFVTCSPGTKDWPGWTREATNEAIDNEIERTGHGGLAWFRINPEDMPADRLHRDAWVWNGSKVVVDLNRIKPTPTLDKPPSIVDTGPGSIRVDFDPTPLYEEIDKLRREVVDQFAANTQAIIDYLVRYMSEINIAMNALKSDAEASDDKVRMVRERCRHMLAHEGASLNPRRSWQERAQEIVAQHDADAIRLMGTS